MSFAKKSLGQNFLTDVEYVRRIVDAADLKADDVVVEVGPGRGALTELMLDKAGKVIAIELDRDLIPVLNDRFCGSENFEIINGDILEIDLSKFEMGRDKVKIIANLPYYISTAVLQRLMSERKYISTMVLMFQREVVDRITAPPGNSDRGYLSVLAETFLNVEKLFDVPPTAFRPRPKVWSSVVRATPKEADSTFGEREQEFVRLVGAGFRQKRKTILNNFKSATEIVARPVELLLQADIDPTRRAETLTVDEWKSIFTAYAA